MFGSLSPKWLERKKVRKFSQEIEPQEVFLDGLAQKKEKELGLSERKFEVPPSIKNFKFFFVFSLVIFSLLLAKASQLAVWQYSELYGRALQNKSRLLPLRNDRGVIFDRYLQKLVSNLPSFDLVLDKRDLPKNAAEKNRTIESVALAMKKDPEIIKKQVESSLEDTILIQENPGQEELILLATKINDLPGFRIERNTVREYVKGELFSHILGFMGKANQEEFKNLKSKGYFVSDYLGKQGLEKYYEQFLRGQPGILEVEKNVRGEKIKEKILVESKPGNSLVLWLDAKLQEKAVEELEKSLQNVNSKKGVVVALDPKTGGVLALVSLPSFDNNLFSQKAMEKISSNPYQPFFNRAISGQYQTGSTIKPLIASAALEEKIISPEKEIFDEGQIEVKSQYDPEIIYTYRDWTPHGWVNLRKAIAVSCNVYFYTIGGGYKGQKGLGLSLIGKYLRLFGWGKKTGIDLNEETAGLIPTAKWKEENTNEPWYDGDTYHLSIGQGYIGVSPLQVAAAFAAIANGGKLYQPQIVQKIVEGTIETPTSTRELLPKLTRELPISQENLQIVREGMRDAVRYGSSVTLNDLPVKAAAKTGTAQTGKTGYVHSWVTVFAPVENPQIVLTVLVEDVKEGQIATLPVAKAILEWYFSQKPQ